MKNRWWLPATVMTLGIVLAAAAGLWTVLRYDSVELPASSMEPTLRQGDQLTLVDVDGDVRHGDVIVFSGASFEIPRLFAKRVVGLGGGAVACCDESERLLVNGVPVEEEYLLRDGPTYRFTTRVPANSVFVLGDWRNNSADSRRHLDGPHQGAIPLGDVRYRVVAVDGENLVPTSAFVDAGRSGGRSPAPDQRTSLLVVGAGVAVFLSGLVWLVVAISPARGRPACAPPPR
ncbi:signal peptidase I [Amycolatopsis methanolica]|uniref:Signal peptidase I n=1 Tax=Amycolatopsis methanolica 239 TaxID=1068978 RepID=A0A076MHP5_AMYME|nr:signal peptidase I [Amycolatopsis methanolica]AIJ20239.1 signal peptidase I [Amycolatopsis methanolica 239]